MKKALSRFTALTVAWLAFYTHSPNAYNRFMLAVMAAFVVVVLVLDTLRDWLPEPPESLQAKAYRGELPQQVLKDYAEVLGKTFVVQGVHGYEGSDLIDVGGPLVVRVLETPKSDLVPVCDGWLDPCWNVEVLGWPEGVSPLRNPYIYGHSYRLSTGQAQRTDMRPETCREKICRWWKG